MNRDIASGLVLFGIAAAYYYGAAILPTSILDTAVSSSTFPKIIGGAGMILSAILIMQGALRLRAADTAGNNMDTADWLRHRKALGLLLIGCGYLIVLELLGYMIALLALIPAIAAYHGVRPGRTLVIVSIAGAALFWLFFVRLLGIHMPPGLLWRAIGLLPY